MERACAVCGSRFEAARADARYCSGRCRMAASRKAKDAAPVVALRPAPAPTVAVATILDAVRAELADLGDTPEKLRALRLAALLDDPMTQPSATPTIDRQLGVVLAQLRAAQVATEPTAAQRARDELAARRAAHAG